MKQYCRYCVHCYVGNGNWCDAKEKEITDSYITHTNNCSKFDFCSVDVYDPDHEYRPRDYRQRQKRQPPIENYNIFE